ncbi:hypothetical protein MM236_05385 [Belliella sp. DSM 107340]|uniref:Uncharacterized protein n=1 Tax=Belliella calami TaxID=2923436 RepID=A0ABS9ULJ8_9BACT|nr:hypothetical protein [Belliella calami]MCH7397408.1 hypothetical protein [Belliella calami]
MKKILIFTYSLFLAFLLFFTFENTAQGRREVISCPSGDKYVCMHSHGELGTIYRGKGTVVVIH